MTPIEIMAFILAIVTLLKLCLIIFDLKSFKKLKNWWIKLLKKNTMLVTIIILILIAIVGNYLLEIFTIIEIAAVMLLTFLLMALAFLPVIGSMEKVSDEILKKDFLKKYWLQTIIWLALAIWILYVLFA